MALISRLKEALEEFAGMYPSGAVRRDAPANSGEANGALGTLTLDSLGRLRVVQDPDAAASIAFATGADAANQQLRMLQLLFDEQRKTNVLLLSLLSSAGVQINKQDLKDTVE